MRGQLNAAPIEGVSLDFASGSANLRKVFSEFRDLALGVQFTNLHQGYPGCRDQRKGVFLADAALRREGRITPQIEKEFTNVST